MPGRKLTLRRESLSSLASDDLQVVAGASASPLAGGSCNPALCQIAIWNSVKPTCQETLCVYCPR